jgi:hypothetical protein
MGAFERLNRCAGQPVGLAGDGGEGFLAGGNGGDRIGAGDWGGSVDSCDGDITLDS